ncbi:unnamed protein product [Auanema sp. JU1783]|nr:unnamed protein product [Auanema sp. JU1783]
MGSKYKELQEDEKIAIQSIFEEAVFEKNAWNVWKPIAVKIHLLPTQSDSRSKSNDQVSLTLTVSCGERYPDQLPTICLEDTRGIIDSDVIELKKKLTEKMQELIGQCMILELCDLVRVFLYEKNVPVAYCHENMVKQKALEASNENRCRANSEKREFETIAEERELKMSELDWSKDVGVDCSNLEVRLIGLHSVYVKTNKEVRPSLHNNCEEWRGVFQGTDILVSEWTFHHTRKKTPHSVCKQLDVDECNKLITEIEDHLRSYRIVLGNEQSIVPIVFAELEKRAVEKNSIHFKVYIGQKIGLNDVVLSNYQFKKNPSLTIKELSAHAVLALRFLHNRQISHGSLSSSSVWYSNDFFVFSDAVLLSLMCWATNSFSQLCSECTSWNSFVNGDSALRKKDLCSLASLIDSLRTKYSSQLSLCPYKEYLDDFINSCQTAKSMDELLEHQFLMLNMVTNTGSFPQINLTASDVKKSRMVKDFISLRMLGKGGFGQVMLAKNKLDSSNYAIKIIPLYPKNKKLNKKIAKEAELFSQLNHPNVVRYYNSWIEEVNTVSPSSSASSAQTNFIDSEDSILPSKLQNIENRCLSLHADTVEWSTSFRHTNEDHVDSSSEDDESVDDHMNNRRNALSESAEDSFILFENSQKSKSYSCGKPEESSQSESDSVEVHAIQLLYIQMEYCEKSTLRGVIDRKELHTFPRKVWKLFSDMLKGIQYIHDKQMIHRDITPSNVLIDAAGQGKIGDFGLATHLLQKDSDGREISAENYPHLATQTRDIGTELYMAPELFVVGSSKQYDSKIDVYSCGVVLFEMFYRPLPPGQDRLVTIGNLKKSGKVPADFSVGYPAPQANLARKFIESMLQLEAEARPTIQELISNDERPIVEINDDNFQHTFKNIMKKRNGRMHNWLMDTLFDYHDLPAKNYYYDNELCNEKASKNLDVNMHLVKNELAEILSLRCFQPFNNHLLSPDSSISDKSELRPKLVKLIDQTGFTVNLPVDLKYNFVRYCARNSIKRFKRFTFDRVFTKQEIIDCHPSERWDCSVDCIGHECASSTLSVEIMCCINDICNEFLKDINNSSMRVGDCRLIKAALNHLTVKEDKKADILLALHKLYTSQKPITNQTRIDVVSAILGPKVATSFMSHLPMENSFLAFKEGCKSLLNSKNADVRTSAMEAVNDLENLFESLHSIPLFDSEKPAIIFDAATTYRPTIFQDGLVFILYCEQYSKKTHFSSVAVAGGRYDSMLERIRQSKDLPPPHPLCLIGCAISLNTLAAVKRYEPNEFTTVICSFNSEFSREKFKLAKMCRECGIPVDIFHHPIECMDSLYNYLREKHIQNALIVFGPDEALVIRGSQDHGKQGLQLAVNLLTSTIPNSEIGRSERNITLTAKDSKIASLANCNFSFADSVKMHTKDKRRVENKVKNKLATVISMFANSCRIEVCINSLSSEMVNLISAALKKSTELSTMKSLFEAWGKQFGKFKQDLESVYKFCNEVYSNIDMLI